MATNKLLYGASRGDIQSRSWQRAAMNQTPNKPTSIHVPKPVALPPKPITDLTPLKYPEPEQPQRPAPVKRLVLRIAELEKRLAIVEKQLKTQNLK